MTKIENYLKELCARLPYGLKVKHDAQDFPSTLEWVDVERMSAGRKADKPGVGSDCGSIEFIKPYLRLMSSMTEEEMKEYKHLIAFSGSPNGSLELLRWVYKKHFNISLPKDMFIEVTEENNPYKINQS